MSLFLNYDESRVQKLNQKTVYPKAEQYFGSYYPEMGSEQEIKKAFTFDGVPANVGDTSLAGTAHGNYRNYVYGKQLWAQMNIRPTAFTAVPRNQYVKSAFRIILDFASTALIPNAVQESYSHIPDITVPKISSLRVDPRVIINDPYSMTLAQQALDGLDDTVNFDAILEVLQSEFSMRVNGQMLMRNYMQGFNTSAYGTTTGAPNGTQVNYAYYLSNYLNNQLPDPIGVPLAPLDNLISSNGEYNLLSGLPSATPALCIPATALFNFDRSNGASGYTTYCDANSYSANLDAFVDYGGSGNSSLRSLSVDLLDNALQNIMPYWKDNTVEGKVILTGFDTVGRLQQLHYQYQRFIGYTNYQVTYNGIKTCPGDVVGFGVSQFKGIPIVPDLMTTKEFVTSGTSAMSSAAAAVSGGLSRIYIMDTNTLHHAILIPPTFIQDKTYLARRALTDVATYYMSSQMVCTKPRANAKIMLIQ